jgi:uncharacterized protein (DUF1778 family)
MITKLPRGGTLKAKPIVVYPSSETERKLFDEQAAREGRSLSNFMVQCANEHIARIRSAQSK